MKLYLKAKLTSGSCESLCEGPGLDESYPTQEAAQSACDRSNAISQSDGIGEWIYFISLAREVEKKQLHN